MNIFSDFKKNKQENSGGLFAVKEGTLKYGELENYSYKMQWTEDSFSVDSGNVDTMRTNFEFKKVFLVGFILSIFLMILLARTAYLQIVKGEYYYSMAEGNRIRIERIEPKRGVIYDKNFVPLVRNKANFILYFIPADLPRDAEEKNNLIDNISQIVKFGKSQVQDKLKKVIIGSLESYRPLFIVDSIEYEKAMQLYLLSDQMPGVVVTTRTQREYNLYSMSLSHILGYTGKINQKELKNYGDDYSQIDYIGKMGVEYFWENELRGVNGKKQVEVDALGKEKRIMSKTESKDGHNLVLSLDIKMQKKLEEILLAKLEEINKTRASAVIMDPNNGEILSLVSIPSYDNNAFARGISHDEYNSLINHPDNPLFNRAVSGEFPSGSTIKPVMAAAALQEGVITESTSFKSVGGIKIGEWFFPDWRAGGHGITNVRKAIAQSVNTFFYYIGGGYNDFKGLGLERIVEYEKKFGLGTQTGIDLAGEASGFLPTREWKEEAKNERWYIGDTYHLSIGQGDLLVTPLQVANFTSFFANGGKMYRPHLIKQILSGDDKEVQNVASSPVRQNFIDDYNVEVVRQGMRQTVTNGSARSLGSLPVKVAGKTGTAQWSTKHNYHAWFTGFAPYDDPELAITILVEDAGGGDVIAVPIVRDFLNWYYTDYKPVDKSE